MARTNSFTLITRMRSRSLSGPCRVVSFQDYQRGVQPRRWGDKVEEIYYQWEFYDNRTKKVVAPSSIREGLFHEGPLSDSLLSLLFNPEPQLPPTDVFNQDHHLRKKTKTGRAWAPSKTTSSSATSLESKETPSLTGKAVEISRLSTMVRCD